MFDESQSSGTLLFPRTRISEIGLLQNGVFQSIRGNPEPTIEPDRPFELHWVTDGEDGWMDVQVSFSRDGMFFEAARLSFNVATGCSKHYAASISSLPAGWQYELHVLYGNSEVSRTANPCPGVDFPSTELAFAVDPPSWRGRFHFDSLPAATQIPKITITRIE
jgi:hypothetical protein